MSLSKPLRCSYSNRKERCETFHLGNLLSSVAIAQTLDFGEVSPLNSISPWIFDVAVGSSFSMNTSPCEPSMAFTSCPSRRFPVKCLLCRLRFVQPQG